MNIINRLQDWFVSQCNGKWEHRLAICISTSDNPGWIVNIDLNGTSLERRAFEVVSKNVSEKFIDQSLGEIKTPFKAESPLAKEWMICFVKEGKFVGSGDGQRLEEILEVFLKEAQRSL
jgi:hypothetical protein